MEERVKRYSAVIVPIDSDQTPFGVTVSAESEAEARGKLEQEFGALAVHALHEDVRTAPSRRPGTS